MIADKSHWILKAEQSNITECEHHCREDASFWQWFVVSKGDCYCLEAIVTGFWHEDDCKKKIQDEEKVTVHRLWHISCPPLASIPEKALVLTNHDPSFQIDSTAVFDCILGHETDDGLTSINTQCQPDGTWSLSTDNFPECKPKTCSNLDQNVTLKASWELRHHVKILKDEYVEHSTVSLHCPKDQYFFERYGESILERINIINVTCKGDGNWHVSHYVGCMGSDYNGDDPKTECKVLPVENLSCNYPKCLNHESIFDEGRKLKHNKENFYEPINFINDLEIESDVELTKENYNTTVGSLIEFQCSQPSHRFKLMDKTSAEKIIYNCTFPGFTDDNGIQFSKWKWNYNGQWLTELPECYKSCIDEPMPDDPPNLVRVWDKYHWTDSGLHYSCRKGTYFVYQK